VHLLYVFQVLGTHYLELYSDKAQVETDKAIAKEFLNEGGFVKSVFGNDVCVLTLNQPRTRKCVGSLHKSIKKLYRGYNTRR
jgi:hypothetical protein